ncbi:MAG: hypothetical protein KA369_19530 [Spirochaetes bacterium]|nr:hypothetical protein [Spirochaetota bacterium]
MKKSNVAFVAISIIIFAAIILGLPHLSPAGAAEVGYRKLMLGNSRERVREIVKNNFEGEYQVANGGDNALVLKKIAVDKPVLLIELIFDHASILYKINVKIRKMPGNPGPDEVMKVIEEKYGAPAKRKITNTLDLIAYWYPEGGRYEIFFHNISSWDKFDIQYTDTFLQKKKDQRDEELNKKPVKKELDF